MKKIILYGAGGHAKVIADIVRREKRYTLLGFVDDDPTKRGRQLVHLPIVQTVEDIASSSEEGSLGFIVAIGNNQVRSEVSFKLLNSGLQLVTAIHPSAQIADDVHVGEGTVVMGGVVVNSGTVIGQNSILNTGCHVDHDCILGDSVHIAPGANLAGHVSVGSLTHVGIGSCVIQNKAIGKKVTIGAGAVVIRDVDDCSVVVGNPAKLLRRIS